MADCFIYFLFHVRSIGLNCFKVYFFYASQFIFTILVLICTGNSNNVLIILICAESFFLPSENHLHAAVITGFHFLDPFFVIHFERVLWKRRT